MSFQIPLPGFESAALTQAAISPDDLIHRVVTWTSHGRGVQKEKTGTIIAFVPKGKDIMDMIPKGTHHPRLLCNRINMIHDRFLVLVIRYSTTFYYGPFAGRIKGEFTHDSDLKRGKR